MDNHMSGDAILASEETYSDSYFSSYLTFCCFVFCIIDYRCFYFSCPLCVLHDLVLLLIQVLLILCDKDRVSLRLVCQG